MAAGEPAQPFAEARPPGSLSMTSYVLGMTPPPARSAGEAAAMPVDTPPEQTNM